jgi:hypothetical protein
MDGTALPDLHRMLEGTALWLSHRRRRSGRRRDVYGHDAAGSQLDSLPPHRRLAQREQPYNYNLDASTSIPMFSNVAAALETQGSDPSDSSGKIYVRGSDKRIWMMPFEAEHFGEWQAFRELPGTGDVSDPGAVSWGPGRHDVVARQGDTIWLNTFGSGTWTGWRSLGTPPSKPVSAPAIGSWGAGSLFAFVTAEDTHVYWKTCIRNCKDRRGGWGDWSIVPNGNVIGKPSVVGRTDGVIDIMVHGTDGHLWWNLWDHGVWGGWARIRDKNLKFDAFCPDCSAPAVVSRGPGLVDALIRGEDDQLWITSWQPSTASWSEFMPLGGVLRSSPSGTGRGGQSLDTFVIMREERTLKQSVFGVWWKHHSG